MNNKIIKILIFFIILLFLIILGFFVVVVGLLIFYFSVKLIKNGLNFNKFDIIFFIILSVYFLLNLLIIIIDGDILRYLDVGICVLLCIFMYFFIKNEIFKGVNLDNILCILIILVFFGVLVFVFY